MEQQTWECLFDTHSGRYFFHNELTGSTTWEVPADWQRMWFIDSQYRTRYFQDRVSAWWLERSGFGLPRASRLLCWVVTALVCGTIGVESRVFMRGTHTWCFVGDIMLHLSRYTVGDGRGWMGKQVRPFTRKIDFSRSRRQWCRCA